MAGDPGLMFTLYFPIIFALNSKVGIKFIGSVILCEWMNQVSLKVAIGHRLLEMNYLISTEFCQLLLNIDNFVL